MNRTIALLVLPFFTGCGIVNLNPTTWFADEEVNPPVELQNIDEEVELRRIWSASIGNGQGSDYFELTPAIDGERIFAASEDGNIYGLELDSGDVIWRTRLDDETVTGGVGAGRGLVLVGTANAEVIAFNQFTGEELWRGAVTSEVLSPPQTNGDVVVAQTVDGKLIALDAGDGARRWIYETTLPALTLRGTNRPVITPQGFVIAGFSNGTLVSVAADDGIWRWEERIAVPEGRYDIERVIDADGDLQLDGNRVLASSYQGNVMAFDIATGRIVWGMEASSYHGLDQGFGNIYYSSEASHVVAVRDNSNDIVWTNEDLEHRALTGPKTVGNYIVVADFEGWLHVISQIDGRIVGRMRVDNDGVRANILADGSRLYVYGNSGTLMALAIQ
ncbi:MAG: outer membrane protein assembly factor BamB [Gammaproteobacteria bacterium]|nr:outer membrane protein assembly factor BamB [Gammaproteobacteria bacterium]MYA36268.1 outer membrane protein assembly factor BamB [Gammaproteobacteria bacterium]MYA66816.1 outer membrane protein assembly factor BamB [Gammaproteobacteria bacterium]MYC60424.1 outer membrane protein assembly factor BamB [Gammaproteobacteria bacterium]MYE28138.1 outer membrane protein assembly factor BamB [Gammaproteobacteria bacterium]